MTTAVWLVVVATLLIGLAGWRVAFVVFERDRHIDALSAQLRVASDDTAERDRRLEAQDILLRQAKTFLQREIELKQRFAE